MLRKILENKDFIILVTIIATMASVIIYNIIHHGI